MKEEIFFEAKTFFVVRVTRTQVLADNQVLADISGSIYLSFYILVHFRGKLARTSTSSFFLVGIFVLISTSNSRFGEA